jgi:hypothetical protein
MAALQILSNHITVIFKEYEQLDEPGEIAEESLPQDLQP